MLAWSWFLGAAWAGEAELEACCRAAGLAPCEPQLRVVGERTRVSRDPGGWLLEGVEIYACDGGAGFDASAVVYLDHAPLTGELAMPEVAAAAVACLVERCSPPPGRCVGPPDAAGIRVLRACEVATTGTRVIIGAKVIVAEPVDVATSYVTTPPAGTAGSGSVRPAGLPPVQGVSLPDPVSALVAGLPPDPTAPCQASTDSARVESRQLVLYADDLRIAGDHPGALARFRAALTVDRCNAYGWLGLGQAAAALSRPDLAIRALKNATVLMPRHYGAWTELGKAYEVVGQPASAKDAYQRALALNADYPEAQAGAKRLAP